VSRWPIVDRNQLRLPDLGRDADRWLLAGAIDHPSGGFRAAVTHLSWRLDDGDLRRAQVDAIVTHLDAQPPQPGPTVLAGDLNAPPDADEIRLLTGRHSQGPRSSASLPDY
jgi:endonuclease/exonuclease/phosphatase family metal-dependent hydrolase